MQRRCEKQKRKMTHYMRKTKIQMMTDFSLEEARRKCDIFLKVLKENNSQSKFYIYQ